MTLIQGLGTALGPIVAVFIGAAILSFILTPQLRRILVRYRVVDRPGARRIHLKPIPRSGGLAVAAAFLVVAAGFLIVNDQAALTRD